MEEDLKIYAQITEKKEDSGFAKLIIVRHAESMGNLEGVFQGKNYDTNLSSFGHRQAEALSERLKEFNVRRIISSPARRTQETAHHVAQKVNCVVEVSEQIIEGHHGKWEGKNESWVKENFPDIYKLYSETPSKVTFPDGESFLDIVKRAFGFLEDSIFESDTLVVSHDNIIRPMLSILTNRNIDGMWGIPLERTSLNIFEVNRVNGKNMFRLVSLNDTKHLSNLEF